MSRLPSPKIFPAILIFFDKTSCILYVFMLYSIKSRTVPWPPHRIAPAVCVRPSGRSASDQGPLHTSTVISWSEHGKTRLRTLPPGELAHFRQLTENYRDRKSTRLN